MFNFAVPGCAIVPRSNAEILDHVSSDSAPSDRVINELVHALKREIDSEAHEEVVEKLYSGDPKEKPPATYETSGMLKYGATPLLFSGSSRNSFKLKEVYLPRKDVFIAKDDKMGHEDSRVTWNGADVLMLDFEDGNRKNPFNFYVGECKLTREDLWHLAVQFRPNSGISTWPDYWAVLQCPFCARLASPSSDNDDLDNDYYAESEPETFVMVCQFILQKVGDQITQRAMPRLCCQECFVENLTPNGFDWGNYPDAKGHSLARLHFDKYHPLYGEKALKTYTLSSLFESSGMCSAASHYMARRLAHRGTGGGGSVAKLREKILKQKSRKNQHKMMVDLKVQEKRQCVACGIYNYGCKACPDCQMVFYCGDDCEKTYGKTHRLTCGSEKTNQALKPNTNIVVIKRSIPEAEICKACGINTSDGGANPSMCFRCGDFICCGPCHGRPEMNGKNGMPAGNLSMVCLDCREKDGNSQNEELPGIALRELMRRKPVGRHINYLRLVLAQYRLNDTYKLTGVHMDKEIAKNEYLWLANNCDYAPAQLALATFYDPVCVSNKSSWDGPSSIHTGNNKIPNSASPFKPNEKLAKRYYDRACEQKLSMALGQVGIMHKNGNGIYGQDMFTALKMLEDAARMGDAKAMANFARLLMSSNGNAEKAIKFFRRAAEYGNQKSMFTVAQLGLRDARMRGSGRLHMQRLVDDRWRPTYEEQGQKAFMKMCEFYCV